MKIKKGDNVLIMKGKDRRHKGKVLRVIPAENRVIVEGLNMRKKHIKPKRAGEKGQIVEQPSPIQIANIMLLCQKCSKPARFSIKKVGDKKYRVCKRCGGEF